MDVINRNSVPSFTTKDGSTIREILAPRNSVIERQSLAEAILEPGCATEAHYHPITEEIYYILSGSGVIKIEDEIREIGPADAVAIPPGARHQIKNNGSVDLVFLCCCAPSYEHEDTIMVEALL